MLVGHCITLVKLLIFKILVWEKLLKHARCGCAWHLEVSILNISHLRIPTIFSTVHTTAFPLFRVLPLECASVGDYSINLKPTASFKLIQMVSCRRLLRAVRDAPSDIRWHQRENCMIPVISLFINVKNAIEEGIRRTNIRLTGTLQLVMSFVMPLYWQYVYEYSNKHSNSLKKQLSSTVVCNFSLDVRKNHCNFPFKFCLNE